MMSSTKDTTFSHNLPPYSPIVYEPPVKYPFPFETVYSREPARVRAVFDDLVEKTKEMNLGKPEVPSGKRRARNLGLKVNIEQAKGLHWRSIQARHPVQLTAGPLSPLRTPRRPATDYPSAEQLCLKNMADAQKKQDYAEACRWSIFAERERAISKWEVEQAAALHARQVNGPDSATDLSVLSPSSGPRRSALEHGASGWERHFSPVDPGPSNAPRADKNLNSRLYGDSPALYSQSDEPQYQTVIEIPEPLTDRSQSIRPEAGGSSYPLAGHDQLQSFNIPRGSDPSVRNVRLARSSSMQRHIPATSLRMAPTPMRPIIDHHPLSYPSPQATRLSYVQPADSTAQAPSQSLSDTFGYPINSNLSALSSSQMTVPSMGSDTSASAIIPSLSQERRLTFNTEPVFRGRVFSQETKV